MRTQTRNSRLSTPCGIAAGLALVVYGQVAQAKANSLVSIGVGASLSMAQNSSLAREEAKGVSGEFSIRARALHVLGLEFAYGPSDAIVDSRTNVRHDTRMKLSGLLHFIPTRPFGMYLKAGVGGARLKDVVKVGKSSPSYHAGGGALLSWGDHVEFGAEYLATIPGYDSWNTDPKSVVDSMSSRATGGANAFQPKFQDIVGVVAHRITASVRYLF